MRKTLPIVIAPRAEQRPDPALDVEHELPVTAGLKPSRFNIRLGAVVYNPLSGRLVRPAPGEAAGLEAVYAGRAAEVAADVLASLMEWGLVVDARVDELRLLAHAFLASQLSERSPIQLTIAPTLDCNFGCSYCYETHARGVMPGPVRAALASFLRARAGAPPRALAVTWFGGEPTLALEVIAELAGRFDALEAEGALSGWGSDLVTNGSLLTPQACAALAGPARVRSAQITVDGPRRLHDARRVQRRRPRETFDRVCAGVLELARHVPSVQVRVNVDRRNCEALEEMMEELAGRGFFDVQGIHPYLAQVEAHALGDGTRAHTLTPAEFGAVVERFKETCRARGWPVPVRGLDRAYRGVCQVDQANAFVVDPGGRLMKCWAELGNAPGVVADLAVPATWQAPRASPLETRDPLDDSACTACKLLPVCMGGCAYQRALWRGSGSRPCPPMKFDFSPTLAELVSARPGKGDGGECI